MAINEHPIADKLPYLSKMLEVFFHQDYDLVIEAHLMDHPPSWKPVDLAFDALLTYALTYSAAEQSSIIREIDIFISTADRPKQEFLLRYAPEWEMTTKRSANTVLKQVQDELKIKVSHA